MIKQTLLTAGNAKIIKGEALGYMTKGIHLAPANLSGYETCKWRSKGCTMACLNTAGRGIMQNTQKGLTSSQSYQRKLLPRLSRQAKRE